MDIKRTATMNCEEHPDQEAFATCATCGRPICEICKISFQGMPHCKRCIESGRVMGGPPGPIPLVAPPNYSARVADRFMRAGCAVHPDNISGMGVLVGSKDEFFLMSNLQYFMVLGQFEHIDEDTAFGFSRLAREYAVAHRSGSVWTGGQVFAFGVMTSPNIDDKARDLVLRTPPRFHFVGVEFPVLHDERTNMIQFHHEYHFLGLALYPQMHQFIYQFLVP